METLTIREVASALRVDRRKVSQMIASGDLPALRSGRIIRIDRRALEKAMGVEQVENEAVEVCVSSNC